MKYRYTFRLSESEAMLLNMKLKEPIFGRYPPSTDWELIQEDCGRLFFLPAVFYNTIKQQWAMYPGFEWKIKLTLSRPLNPTDYFGLVQCRPVPFEGHKHIWCLQLNAPNPELKFKWNPATKDIRSIR